MNTNFNKISDYTLHGSTGLSVLDSEWINWVLKVQKKKGFGQESGYGLGKASHYSWHVGDERIEVPIEKWCYALVLPDSSGFIGFEKGTRFDNCILLDVFGKERIRLSIPWQLTKSNKPEVANQESFFINISAPYVNPADGVEGKFGVTARIAHEGKYYFELDYHTGQFLWGKAIWD